MMSPILSLVLAATLSNAEPTREHVELMAAVIELHSSIETASATAGTSSTRTETAFWYDPEAGAALDSVPPVRDEARALVTYTLASPIFRDLL